MSKIYENFMVDLETMGNGKDAAIISIGVQAFNFGETLEGAPSFYTQVSLENAVENGLRIDASTVMWWMKQSDQARAAFKSNASGFSLPQALVNLAAFMSTHCPIDRSVCVWGNGSDFDCAILQTAYRITGIAPHFTPFSGRCYRTMKNMFPTIKLDRIGTHHNALDDARSQAEHLLAIVGAI